MKLDVGGDFKLVNCLDGWMFRAKRIPGSIRFESLKMLWTLSIPRKRSSSIVLTSVARRVCSCTNSSSSTVFRTSGTMRAELAALGGRRFIFSKGIAGIPDCRPSLSDSSIPGTRVSLPVTFRLTGMRLFDRSCSLALEDCVCRPFAIHESLRRQYRSTKTPVRADRSTTRDSFSKSPL